MQKHYLQILILPVQLINEVASLSAKFQKHISATLISQIAENSRATEYDVENLFEKYKKVSLLLKDATFKSILKEAFQNFADNEESSVAQHCKNVAQLL